MDIPGSYNESINRMSLLLVNELSAKEKKENSTITEKNKVWEQSVY